MEQQENKAFPTLEEDVRLALRNWNSGNWKNTNLDYLYLLRKAQRLHEGNISAALQFVLHEALVALEETYGLDAQLLRARFFDKEQVSAVANRLNFADSTVYSKQQEAFKRLADVIRQMENAARTELQSMIGERIGAASYLNLIGIDEHLNYLLDLLNAAASPYLVSIEGIGGLGKTSLADALVRRAVEDSVFDNIGWVTARQQYLGLSGDIESVTASTFTAEALVIALTKQLLPDLMINSEHTLQKLISILEIYLSKHPHLIVVDNLETATDVKQLLPTLQRLANPTKFILTSRERLVAEPNVHHFQLPELNKVHALQLIRQEAEISNLPSLAKGSDQDLGRIFSVVGGNPLAIRLIVGQLHIHSIDTVLMSLAEAQGQSIENLYTFIYRWAWDRLSDLSREILTVMPLVNIHGEDLTFLANVTNLSQGDLQTGLNDLVKLNLVNVQGDLYMRLYSIHSLTRSFLHKQVILWQ